MNQLDFKQLVPHVAAYFIMMALSFLFFLPYFQGKVLTQSDNVRARGMQAEITKYRASEGEIPLWTNSMFGGMPSYQIQMPSGGNQIRHPYSLIFFKQSLTKPQFVVLAAMFCFYLLMITLKVDWRVALIGSIAFGLSNYNIDLAEAGHSTKMGAMALAPGVIAGALMAYRGKYLFGGVLFALFLAMQILANHLQITFYLGLMLIILGLVEFVAAIREQKLPHFFKASTVLAIAALLGIMSNTSRIWATQEYSKETIRGVSELSAKEGKEGLEKDYIFAWSYGKLESMSFLVPTFMGGGASQHFRGTQTHDQIYRRMLNSFTQQGMPRDEAIQSAEQQVAALMYWGDQPFVGVAIYFGAALLFLFVLGGFLVKGKVKYWLLLAALFTLTLAWGKNFFLNGLLVEYAPMFNKFRAVSMALGLTHMAVAILAVLGLQAMVSTKISSEAKQKALMYAAGITAGACVLGILMSFSLDFSNAARDGRIPADLLSVVKSDRASMLRMDALRSIFFILASAGLLFAYLKGKLKALIAVAAVGLLCTLDVWLVNKRVLFAEKYEQPSQTEISASPADQQIMQDKDPHFRVLDLSRGNPFKSADASNFHKSIGGYHAAKLMRFQEVAERYLDPQYGQNPLQHLNILNMLNTKYIIQQAQQGAPAQPAQNPDALGNAWFVNNYELVNNADAELAGLNQLNPKDKALIQQKYSDYLNGLNISPDPSASIRLSNYYPTKMVYETSASSEQLAVFSEVFYSPDKGWKVFLDGQPVDPFVKANYLLRALRVPAGKHEIEMRFEPSSFGTGSLISNVVSILLILAFLAVLFQYLKENGFPE
ncbi:MAG: hypothetical protein AAF985_19980, partial [Bacteroidota bacterium]